MRFKNILLVVVISIAIAACKSFETQVLDDSDKMAVEEGKQTGTLVKGEYFIDDFKGGKGLYWWGGAKVTPTVVGDTQVAILKDAGNKYECWGVEFPAIDMTNAPVIKIRARS